MTVDDIVESVVNKLKEMKELDNTYIFFSSDNGYHLGIYHHIIFACYEK